MRTPVGRSLDAPYTAPTVRSTSGPTGCAWGRRGLGARQQSWQPTQEQDQELSLRASERKSGLDTPSSFFRASGGRVENL